MYVNIFIKTLTQTTYSSFQKSPFLMEFKQAGCFYSAPCLCSYPLPVWILHQFLVSIYFRLRYGKQIVPLFEYPVLMMSPLPKLRTWLIRCSKNIRSEERRVGKGCRSRMVRGG